MAISGAQITFTATPTQLSSIVPVTVRQLDIQSSPDNNDNVYFGGSDLSVADGTGIWGALLPGKAWGADSDSSGEVRVGPDVYVHGTEGESVLIMWVN